MFFLLLLGLSGGCGGGGCSESNTDNAVAVAAGHAGDIDGGLWGNADVGEVEGADVEEELEDLFREGWEGFVAIVDGGGSGNY